MTYFKIHRPVSAAFYMMFDPRLPQILSPVAIIPRTLPSASTSFFCQLSHLCLARDVDGSCHFLALRVGFLRWLDYLSRSLAFLDVPGLAALFPIPEVMELTSASSRFRLCLCGTGPWLSAYRHCFSLITPRLLSSRAPVWLLHSPPVHLMRRAQLVGFFLVLCRSVIDVWSSMSNWDASFCGACFYGAGVGVLMLVLIGQTQALNGQ